ncbi:MAG: TonB-dependent receptor plug domain-containing protein, partial [Nitrospinae bacterium]|nr:TonB-dependent receptor plug domain-containing protein [Nitrospinota bacterium]
MPKTNAFFRPFLTALLISVFWPAPGAAEELSVDKLSEMSLSELMSIDTTTAARTSQKASEAPASITVITRRQIQERGYVNLSDLLEDLPGIDVNRKSAETFFN